MFNISKILTIGVLFLVLAGIRYLEESLFYDPLLFYFKDGYLDAKPLPDFNFLTLTLSVSFRFWLNSLVSLLILYVAFTSMEILKFALFIMAVAFAIFLLIYAYILTHYNPENYLALFYTRRFLIQPLLILLLLPAFYYHRTKKQ